MMINQIIRNDINFSETPIGNYTIVTKDYYIGNCTSLDEEREIQLQKKQNLLQVFDPLLFYSFSSISDRLID